MTLEENTPSSSAPKHTHDWSVGLVERHVRNHESNALLRIVAIFDVLEDLFTRVDPDSRVFIAALTTASDDQAAGRIPGSVGQDLRLLLEILVTESRLIDAAALALALRVLVSGAIITAGQGDPAAISSAKFMATRLLFPELTGNRPTPVGAHPVLVSPFPDLDFNVDAFDRFPDLP